MLFPLPEGAAEALNASRDKPPAEEPEYEKSGTILVVDDEESIRGFLATALGHMGHTVKEAADGREALATFTEHREDIKLVLLDLTMPRMGGEETFSELRRLQPDLPIVLMSGYTEDEVTSLFAGKGITGFLQKPFSMGSLMNMLKNCFV